MSEQKICPTCGTEYPLSERFCPRDGTALRGQSGSADLLGQVVADRYHILKKLGEGGMGQVYLAEHVKMGRKSALKVMNPGMMNDADAIARFNREASNASRINHPNVCGIYDFGETPDGLIYLAMEFIEGESLTALIERNKSLPPARAASIVHQTADALQVAHDYGIVHRDLKPDNIMIAKGRDNTDNVKVVDFGIAKASSSDAQKVTKTGLVVGTPEYMSPEQLAGDKLDGRSDIYSLGLVAFNCLTGKLPFPAETAQEAMIMRLTDRPRTLAETRPDIPWTDAIQAVLDKALARDADERYQSAAQFGRELSAAVADMPQTAAAEAGTLVMGAVAAPAVPATRVASPAAGGTAKIPAAPAPAAPSPVAVKKSSVPMIAGGGGVLAVAAVVGWLMMSKGGEPPAPGAVDSTALGGAKGAAVSTPPASIPSATTTPPGANPGPSAQPTGGVEPLSKQMKPTGGRDRTDGGGAIDPTLILAEYEKMILDENATIATARSVLRKTDQLRPSLSGAELAESYYVDMLAYTKLQDQRVCDAARTVKATHPRAPRRSAAEFSLNQLCQ